MSGASHHGLEDDLEEQVAALLADEQYVDHPLRKALEQVMERMGQQLSRLERITQISDRYQTGAQERVLHVSRRYDRQIRKLEKAIRISDRYQAMLNDLNKALQEASTHDQLTGLPNRRLMADRCRREDHRCQREDSTYSLLAIDVDRFKSINDTYGHEAGDTVLVELGQAFRRGLRDYDSCARWGGEEFLALLIGADLSTAQHVAQRILETVRSLCVDLPGGVIYPRVSIGVAEHCAGELYNDVYRRADAALLRAKESGRDRFLVADAPTELDMQSTSQHRSDHPPG